jgi:DNA processing protein
MAEDRRELAAWLRLTLTPGIGGEARRALLKSFGLPQAIYDAGPRALATVIDPGLVEHLLAHDCGAAIEAALAWADQAGNRLLTLADEDYPQSLLSG